jgi:hypothetical protein
LGLRGGFGVGLNEREFNERACEFLRIDGIASFHAR